MNFLVDGNKSRWIYSASKQLLDRIKPGWDVSTNEDDEIRSFDEIQDEIRNHPGRKALDDHKERMQQKGPVKINGGIK